MVAHDASATTDGGNLTQSGAEGEPEDGPDDDVSAARSAPDGSEGSTAGAATIRSFRSGAEVWADDGFAALQGRRVALITNEAARVGDETVVDAMVAAGVDVVALFAPEHGFGITADAGATVADGVHPAHGIPVYSIYGDRRAPTADALAEVDVVVFDLQDVGVRAYTYLASMGLAMEVAAAVGVPFVVLDRPNPLGGRLVEGWTRDPDLVSFVSQYPIPAVHGLTAGELALALGGEGWLAVDGLDLTVVRIDGWRRDETWPADVPWIAPSPSLPDRDGVALYPGLVLLEATTVSVGRGTERPFTVFGAPGLDAAAVAEMLSAQDLPGVRFEATSFTPQPSAVTPAPLHAGQAVPGVRITVDDAATVRPLALGVHVLAALEQQAAATGQGSVIDRPAMLDLLAGTAALRTGLAEGRSAADLVATWAADTDGFDGLRQPYLLYD